MIIVALCIVILCRRSCRKKSSDAGNQVSQRKTELNTAISKTNPIYDAIIKLDSVDNKQGSDVSIITNPSYEVSNKFNDSNAGKDEYNYALPYQIKEHSDHINMAASSSHRLNKSEDRTTVFGANTKSHQSSCSAIHKQCHYVNACVTNTKPTGKDEDSHYYSTIK